MAKKSTKTEAPAPIDLTDLTAERLAQAVFDGMGTRLREEMPLADIRAVAEKLVYKDKRPTRTSPALMVASDVLSVSPYPTPSVREALLKTSRARVWRARGIGEPPPPSCHTDERS